MTQIRSDFNLPGGDFTSAKRAKSVCGRSVRAIIGAIGETVAHVETGAGQVLGAAAELTRTSENLRAELLKFLETVRAA